MNKFANQQGDLLSKLKNNPIMISNSCGFGAALFRIPRFCSTTNLVPHPRTLRFSTPTFDRGWGLKHGDNPGPYDFARAEMVQDAITETKLWTGG